MEKETKNALCGLSLDEIRLIKKLSNIDVFDDINNRCMIALGKDINNLTRCNVDRDDHIKMPNGSRSKYDLKKLSSMRIFTVGGLDCVLQVIIENDIKPTCEMTLNLFELTDKKVFDENGYCIMVVKKSDNQKEHDKKVQLCRAHISNHKHDTGLFKNYDISTKLPYIEHDKENNYSTLNTDCVIL